MSGLSMATGVDGFMRAVDFWDGHKDRKQMRGLRDAEAKRADERHAVGMRDAEDMRGIRQAEAGRAGERHDAQMSSSRMDRARKAIENQELMFSVLAKEAAALEKGGAPQWSPEESELVDLFPDLSVSNLTSDAMGAALQNAERVINGELDLRSPEAIEAMNALFPEVQAGADDGRKRRVVAAAPGKQPETLVFGLEVEGEKSPKPLTARRSSDDDDPVKQVKIEDMVRKVAAKKNLREMLMTPQGRQYLLQRAGHSGQPQYSDVFVDEKTGLIGQTERGTNKFTKLGISGEGAAGVGGRGAADPAEYRLAKLIQKEYEAEGQSLTFDQAWSKVKLAVSDPVRYVSDFVRTQTEAQAMMPVSQRKSTQQIEQDAIDSFRRIRQLSSEAGGNEPQQRIEAPPQAIDFLRQNPHLRDQFMNKYGYLPEL